MIGEEKQNEKQNGYERAIKYIGIFGSVQGFSLFVNLVKNKFASKLLGTSGFGIIALYNRTLQMLSDFTNLSLSFSAVRKISEYYEEGDKEKLLYSIKVLRSWAFLTAVIGVIVSVSLSSFLGKIVFEGNEYYTSRFLLLSPVVGFMAITGSELAILKGVHKIDKVAIYTFISSLCALFVSVPFYFFMGIAGIFPSIFIVAFLQMSILLAFTVPSYKYVISPFSTDILRDGADMVKLGLGYIFAAIMGSGSMWLVCKMLVDIGNGETVGLFSIGYFLMNVVPGILLASIDSDFYPRLSAVNSNVGIRNKLVNEQAEVQLLIQSPILIGYVVVLPLLLPLFYDYEFIDAVPMVQISMFGMFIRTMTYPMSYLSLSCGDSGIYMFQEAVYDILFVILVIIGYKFGGLYGIGIAMAIVFILDWITVCCITGYKYAFCFCRSIYSSFFLQTVIFVSAIVCSCIFSVSEPLYWFTGFFCTVVSGIVSLYMFSNKVSLKGRFLKFMKRFLR